MGRIARYTRVAKTVFLRREFSLSLRVLSRISRAGSPERHANPCRRSIYILRPDWFAPCLSDRHKSIGRAVFQGSVYRVIRAWRARPRVFRNVYEEEPGDLLLLGCVYATITAANIPLPSVSLSLSFPLSVSLSLSLSLSSLPPVEFPRRKLRNGRATAVTVTPDGNWHALPAYITFASTYDLCQLRTTDIDCSPGFSTGFE